MREPSGLERMAIVSAVAHGAILAALIFAPKGWLSNGSEAPKTVMSISLGGGVPGPANGGMTTIGGKAVQEPAPPEAKREPERPPAAKTPEMTLPQPKAKPTKAPQTVVKEAPDQAKGRTPSKGEPTPGTSNVDTGVRGQGFGLSTGGGKGSGSSLDVDIGTFCCPDWLTQSLEIIRRNWNDQSEVHDSTKIRFTIQRDGTITDVKVERPSRSTTNTIAAQRAVLATPRVLPLPREFTNPTLTIGLVFEYQ
jgi:outer membrane biosynthesis protein TonB